MLALTTVAGAKLTAANFITPAGVAKVSTPLDQRAIR